MLKLVIAFLTLSQLWTETIAVPAFSTNDIRDVLEEEISAAITKAVNDAEKKINGPVNDDGKERQDAVNDDEYKVNDIATKYNILESSVKDIAQNSKVIANTLVQIWNALKKNQVVNTFRGSCLDSNGHYIRIGVHHIAADVSMSECLSKCRATPDATGCVYFDGSSKIKKYCDAIKGVEVVRGSGFSSHTCWKLKPGLS